MHVARAKVKLRTQLAKSALVPLIKDVTHLKKLEQTSCVMLTHTTRPARLSTCLQKPLHANV